ncbi:Membrane protein [Yersinia intermedia]|uniref:darobactin export ABC transporter permease subunit n=1 Tax=Yersinia intermedia TaxID=631 RepID=UPI0005E2C02C|nr:darobactin export ABC transporter permease subunit [Yersinia intermedia]MDA5511748.1 darobactin export ABC transporter permease subunit [Yersinia intermedia]CNH26557.1 Membrane protein [Yersinia intermedia]CQD75360.1 Membrane protein [Yersinia intermedia]
MFTSEFINDVKLSPMASILAIIITALGMLSSFLVLLLYLTDRSIESYHNDHTQIYRIETQFNLPNGDDVKSAQVPFPLIPALQNAKNIKEVIYALRLFTDLQVNDQTHSKVEIYAVSPNFFNVINPYKLSNDLPNLYEPNIFQYRPHLTQNEIIITPEFNRQYLHLDNPVGHVITLGNKGQFVIKDMVSLHKDSRFKTNAVIAFSPELVDGYHDKRHDWYDMHAYAFITMDAGGKPNSEQLNTLVTRYAPQLPGAPFSPEEFIQLSARNITDIHYDNGLPDEISTVIAKSYLYSLYAAGIFIFITTTMNFFNVNNVINTNKKNSFQIKKSLGASRYQLLTESLSIALLQAIFVLLLAILFLIVLIQLSIGIKELILIQGTKTLLAAFFFTLISVYTAILISHITYLYVSVFPNQSVHYNIYNQQPISRYIHQGALCIQITIAGIMVYLWAGILTQNNFMQHYDFGYKKDDIVTFTLSDELISQAAINSLQNELKNTVNIESIALSSWQPFDMSRTNTSIFHLNQQEKDKLVTVNTLNANKHFLDTWGVKVLAGYDNVLIPSDDDNVVHAVATQSFMTLMGQHSYDETLNSIFYINDNDSEHKIRILRIINDFYLADVNKSTTPLLIFIENKPQRYGALKLQYIQDLGEVKKTLERYRVNPTQIQTVEHLHQAYFNTNRLMQKTANFVAILSLSLILISTVIISISETKRISKTLRIMESIGGSIYTHIVFFIQQNIAPIIFAAIIAFSMGFFLLHRWLVQYHAVDNLSYVNATATLFIFIISIVVIMTITLIFNNDNINTQKK